MTQLLNGGRVSQYPAEHGADFVKNITQLYLKKNNTVGLLYDTISISEKEDRDMKSVKTFTCDTLIDAVIRKYGFESRQALMFARLVESTNDKRTIITMYNKLITNK